MNFGRTLFFALALAALPATVSAQGFVMGSGRWSCADAIRVFDSGTPIDKGQLFGWLMGFWTAATFDRETGFIDRVEAAGGEAIANATIEECRKAPADTLLYRVAQSMIRNTK